jgi:DNA processing protein
LATGIDTAAHQGALQAAGSLPIGVVGSGHDVVYPPANRSLWSKMAESGVLLAEVPPGTQPLAYRFPLRNRIIAALSEVVVVVESRAAGGSMHTVDQAARRGVPVLAVPGSLNNRAAEGTNRLISEGCQPATDVADVLMAMGLERSGQMRFPVDRRPRPNSADAAVLDLIGTDPVPIDRLVEASGRSVVDVALSLGRLEADGWVLCTGGWFERVHDGVAGR